MKHCYDKNLALKIGALGSRKPFTSRLAEKQPDASVNAFTAAKRRDVATCLLSCAVDLRKCCVQITHAGFPQPCLQWFRLAATVCLSELTKLPAPESQQQVLPIDRVSAVFPFAMVMH